MGIWSTGLLFSDPQFLPQEGELLDLDRPIGDLAVARRHGANRADALEALGLVVNRGTDFPLAQLCENLDLPYSLLKYD